MIRIETLPPDIRPGIERAKTVLQGEERVLFAYLFGGVARGRVTPLSDIDVAVYETVTENLGVFKLDLFTRLAAALGTDELDLVLLGRAPVSLAGRVLQDRVVLVDKHPHRRHVYESLTLRKFFDFRIKEEELFRRRFARRRGEQSTGEKHG